MKQHIKPYFVYPPVMALALYVTVLGYMIPSISDAFKLSLAQAGLFSTLQSIGTVTSVILCFCVFPGLNKTRVMALSTSLLAASMLAFGFSQAIFLIYILFFFIGLFSNITDTLSNAIIADLSPQKKSFHIGLVQALWAAAGAAGPFFAIMLGSSYSPVFLGLGIVTALFAILFMSGLWGEVKQPMLQNTHYMGTVKKLIATFRKKGIKTFVFVNFFSSFAQICIIFFLSSYGKGFSGKFDGAFLLGALFIGNVIGRLLYARVLHTLPPRRIMPLTNTLAIFAFAAMLLSGNHILAACLFAGVGGLGCAVNFPTLVVGLCSLMPDDTSAATSLVFLGYAVASLVAPPLVGAIGDAAGLSIALAVSAAMLIPVVVLSALLRTENAKDSV